MVLKVISITTIKYLGIFKKFFWNFQRFRDTRGCNGNKKFTRFLIILSQVSKFISYDVLRIINSFVSILICLYFFKCLKIRYKDTESFILALIACLIFLSPTVRSLSIWPYSLIWGLLFLVILLFIS